MSQKQKDIIYFLERVAHSNDLRQQVLISFAELFKLEHSTFFLIDPDEKLTDPITLNVNSNSTDRYMEHYQQKDIFHPRNLSRKKLLHQPVMDITDVMSLQSYENTEYYNDFMKPQGFYHEMIINLSMKGKLLGGIGLCKPKEDGFKQDTKETLNLINKVLAGMLAQYLSLMGTEANEQIYKQCINEQSAGIILFDEKLSIIFANGAAAEMVSVLFDKKVNIGQFLEYTVSLSGTLPYSSEAMSLSLYSPELNEFIIRIIPLDARTGFKQRTFLMKMVPGHPAPDRDVDFDKPLTVNIQKTYNLTKRELEVLGLLLQGLTNKELGQKLFISPRTVKAHLRSIFTKTGVDNRFKLYQKLQEINRGR